MQKVIITFYPNCSKNVSLLCEFAGDVFSKRKGLMYRLSLPSNEGILFPFLFSWYRIFWMKNVRIPLDIIFIGKSHRISKIFEASVDSKMYQKEFWAFGFCKYVVECNKGFCKTHKISIGTKTSIEI